MDTPNTLNASGSIDASPYFIAFVANDTCKRITMYDAMNDVGVFRDYATIKDVFEALTLLLTSDTARKEFYNA